MSALVETEHEYRVATEHGVYRVWFAVPLDERLLPGYWVCLFHPFGPLIIDPASGKLLSS